MGPAPAGENAKSKQLEYDAPGRLISVCEITSGGVSGACGQNNAKNGYLTTYAYDATTLGSATVNRTTVTQNAQPGGTPQMRTFLYDLVGRLVSEANPETGATAYVYDSDATCGTSNGDLVKRTDAVGNVTCYTYDQLHRVLSVTYPSGSYSASTAKKYFVYDAATVNGAAMSNAKGYLAEAYTCTSACPGTKITDLGFSYSVRGEPTDVYESTPHSGGYYHVTASYWAHGLTKTLSGIPGVPTLYYGASDGSGLDGEGRITKVTASSGQNPVTGITYTNSGTAQPIGSLAQLTFGSADYDSFSYDVNTGRMSQYQFHVASQTDTGALTWNANGTLKQLAITDQINTANSQTCTFGHDDLSRIASVSCGTTWSQTFSLDPFGNITKSGTSSFLPTYSLASNRFQTVPGGTPTYDANGNLTNDLSHTYSWDAEGKALTIDGSTVGLTYDALGRMVEQARGAAYTEIVYGPGGGKLALMNGQTLSKAFLPLPGGATAVYTASGLAYYRHADWLGSARLASTPSRGVYYDGAYAPYGETYAESGTTDRSFTGQNQDTVAGLYDFMYREYHAVQGRWISPDPAGIAVVDPNSPQSWNRYAYVLNIPTLLIDPLGLDGTCKGFTCTVTGSAPFPTCFELRTCAVGGAEPPPPSLIFRGGQHGPPANKGSQGKGCGAQRIALAAKGLVSFGVGAAKVGIAAGSAALVPATGGVSALGVAYGVIGAAGNFTAGSAQIAGAFSGNVKDANVAADVASTVTTVGGGVALAITGDMEKASFFATAESVFTAGYGGGATGHLIDEAANGFQKAMLSTELGMTILDAVGLGGTDGCPQ